MFDHLYASLHQKFTNIKFSSGKLCDSAIHSVAEQIKCIINKSSVIGYAEIGCRNLLCHMNINDDDDDDNNGVVFTYCFLWHVIRMVAVIGAREKMVSQKKYATVRSSISWKFLNDWKVLNILFNNSYYFIFFGIIFLIKIIQFNVHGFYNEGHRY